MWLFSKFRKVEIEIIAESSTFNNDQEYLEKELNEIISGKARFIGVEEAEEQLTRITETR
jgi:hypothetical protein